MQIYKDGAAAITLGGVTYTADERGIIVIPGDFIPAHACRQGFVSAKGRIAELEQARLNALAHSKTAAAPPAPKTETPTPPAEDAGGALETESKAAKKRS
jgi:hypothetical protein